jgi:hypothetical protein
MHFSGTQGRLYIRKYRPFIETKEGDSIAYPGNDWKSAESKKQYLTALDETPPPGMDNLKFSNYKNFDQIANVVNWSINGSQEVLDATTMADTDRVYVAGPKSATGSARILYYSNISALGSGVERAKDEQNSINKLAARFFKISRNAYKSGVTVQNEYRTHDDGQGSEADPFLFRFQIEDDVNNSIFSPTQTRIANAINIDYWAHITSFNLAVGVGEIFAADISFQCIGSPTVVDL